MAGRILVGYATRHGSTAGVAGAIARELSAMGHHAVLAEFVGIASLEGYDAAVLGAPIYASRPLELAAFVARYREPVRRLPVAAFAVGAAMAATRPDPVRVERSRAALVDALEPVVPVAAALFAGAIDPSTLGLAERISVRLMGGAYGDFRDRDSIRAWARTLVPLFRRGRAA